MRRVLMAVLVSLGIIIGSVTVSSVAAHAATVTCKTTHTYRHTTTSLGTDTQYWYTRYTCGHNYKLWETIKEHSYTGSHYNESIYRYEMHYPHYSQRTVKDAWSAKGVLTHTVTIKSG